jgi:saccharopine dehydrogenase (NAD+, L-lysine forming)
VGCDVEGAIECTVKCTEPGDPVFVFDPLSGSVQDGYKGRGLVIMAVDILPSELPREASAEFGDVLMPYIPALARCDYTVPFEKCELPPAIKRAVIAYQGALTPSYLYIKEYLQQSE